MRVSLIFTKNELNANFDFGKFRDDHVGFIPPLSTLTVAGILEREGVEVQIIDVNAERLSYSQALEKVSEFSPDFLGFSLSTYSFRVLLQWIRKFKEDTQLPVVVGGPHVHLYPEETMTHPEIDYCIVGEAEIPLPQFLKAFQNGKNFEGIKSVGYRKDGKVYIDNTRQTVDDLDALPLPSRHLIDNELYSNILTRKKNFTAMLSSRGCPYLCTFCDQKIPPYRARTPEGFVSEIKHNLIHHNIREFDIYDSTFTANRKRVIEISEEIKKNNLDVGFTIRSRVDSVNEKVLDSLKEAGCHTIFYGIESSDPDILKLMKKDITLDRIRHIIHYTKSIGIDALGYFFFGYPGETRKSLEKTIDFALELPLDYAQFAVLIPFPETEIYDYYLERGMPDFWSWNTLHPDKEEKVDLIETELNREEMEKYVEIANRKFYMRPRIIFHQMSKVRSLENATRLSKGAYSLFKSLMFSSDGHQPSAG